MSVCRGVPAAVSGLRGHIPADSERAAMAADEAGGDEDHKLAEALLHLLPLPHGQHLAVQQVQVQEGV